MIVKNVEKKEHNAVSFQVELTAEEFEKAVNAAYLKNRKDISVPGFRKGKAPRMVIEGMYGANVFYDDAIESCAPDAFEFAVKQEDLKTVGQPKLAAGDVGDDKSLTLGFEAGLYPEVTLGQYKGVEAPKEEINITDEDVDKYLEEMQKRHGRQVSVERKAKKGDTVEIDYAGYLDGEAFEGGTAEHQSLELGSGSFVPGFEEQLIGAKAGEEKELNITFPEDYHENLAGKAVVFKVKIHDVFQTELPAIDDEFTKDVSEFDTLDEYKTAIREQLVTSRTKAVDDDFGAKVIEAATANMTCDIPEAMIDDRIQSIMMDYDRNLMAQGMRLEEYIRLSGMDFAGFHGMLKPQAEAQVKTELLLEAVVKAEGIEVSEAEIEESIQKISEAYRTTVEEIKKAIPQESMVNDMARKKAYDLVIENAVATAAVKEDDKTEEKPKAKKKAPAKKKAAEEPAAEEKPAE